MINISYLEKALITLSFDASEIDLKSSKQPIVLMMLLLERLHLLG